MRKPFLALAGALILLAGLFTPALAADTLPGMDVSVYQGSIDFSAAAEGGIQVVYIRSSYGETGVDSYLTQHYRGAKTAGLSLGFYHYMDATTVEGARRQALHFASLIRDFSADCRPVMDYETFGDMTPDQITAVGVAFLETLEAELGQTPMVYSDSYSVQNHFSSALARWPLWVAEYGVDRPNIAPYWNTWAGWQYTDQGRVSGVSGNVDRDWFTSAVLLEQSGREYVVRPGDTLWAISQRYGTTVSALAQLNHIPNPNLIYPGQVLQIPDSGQEYLLYTVRPGDTLWALSRRYGTTVSTLAQLNQIANPDLIYVGQVLRIPIAG